MRVFTRWNEVSTSKETNELLTKLALSHCSNIQNEQVREYLTACLRSSDYRALCDYSPPYGSISTFDAAEARQVCAFFSKRHDLVLPGIDRTKAAEDKWVESEILCRETNDIFELVAQGKFSFLPGVDSALLRAQRKIATMLGDVPNLEDLKIRFGPGATTQVKKKNASARRKLSMGFACSEDMLPRVHLYLEELEPWVFVDDKGAESITTLVEVHHGKLVFVLKNAKIDRPVIIEPPLNGLYQLGVGDYMARRFKRFGLDLSDQTLNQRLAREGSLTGALATADLKSASDTNARGLVLDLLPVDWYEFLSELVTSEVVYKGVRIRQEKFSSMGNGFTFPLESLIFFALAHAVCKDGEPVAVYGDDIIVPTHRYQALVQLLTAVGFLVNPDKSFSTGPFRESCGHDYLSGVNIRPCYIKGPIACYDLFRLHNFYVRSGRSELALHLLAYIAPHLQRWGPDGYGDGHLLGDRRSLRPHGRDDGWSGYTFETYRFKARKEKLALLPGDRLYPAYFTYVSDAPPSQEELPGLPDLLYRDGRLVADIPSEYKTLAHKYVRGFLESTLPGRVSYDLIKIYVLTN